MWDFFLKFSLKYFLLGVTLGFVIFLAYLAEMGKALPDPPYHNHSHSPQYHQEEGR